MGTHLQSLKSNLQKMLANRSLRALQFSARRQLSSNLIGGRRALPFRNVGPQMFVENPMFKKFVSPLYWNNKSISVVIRCTVLASTVPVNFVMWQILMQEDAINSMLGEWAQTMNLTTGCVSLPISMAYTAVALNIFCWSF